MKIPQCPARHVHPLHAERTQRARIRSRGDLDERIENGQIIVGSPDSVLSQIKRLHDDVGAGIVELVFAVSDRAQALSAIELFGSKVLPRMRTFETASRGAGSTDGRSQP